MLRGERDQNGAKVAPKEGALIPECSVGSEIKTQRVAAGERDPGYQNAPWGARSKLAAPPTPQVIRDTRMLRGERDQNDRPAMQCDDFRIPECSVGSEIKTQRDRRSSSA